MKRLFACLAFQLVAICSFAQKFVLTHGFDKKLKTPAYFYCGNRPVWTLDYRNGKKITYKPLKFDKYNMLCNIEARDSNGDYCEICITKTDGKNAVVQFKYTAGTLSFKGYYADE
jgi:hypothetical protein